MFIGHFAPAFLAATHPRAPSLPALFVAAQLTDIAFFGLALAGIERLRIVPGITVMNGMDLYHMPYTHSLLGSLAFALAMGLAMHWMTGRAMAAVLAGAVVASHWFLDLLVHRPDLTLAGMPPKLGLGLWNHPLIAIPLELALFVGSFLLWRKSRGKRAGKPAGRTGWTLLLVMLAVQLYNWAAPEPASVSAALPLMALAAFALFIWLAARADDGARGLANPASPR